jgi:hypothetical protein
MPLPTRLNRGTGAKLGSWHDALPDNLCGSATAEALQAIVDLDLDALIAIVPPRGYGRD